VRKNAMELLIDHLLLRLGLSFMANRYCTFTIGILCGDEWRPASLCDLQLCELVTARVDKTSGICCRGRNMNWYLSHLISKY
jgi:hypothetical protein